MSHTPGPWIIGRMLRDPSIIGTSVHMNHPGEPRWAICNLPLALFPEEERIANACLIAAAPELLVALEAAHEFLDHLIRNCCDGEICEEGQPLWEEARDTYNHAMAKVKGKGVLVLSDLSLGDIPGAEG